MNAKEKKLYKALREFHDNDGKLRRAIISLNKSGDIESDTAYEMIEMIDDENDNADSTRAKMVAKSKLRDETDDFAGACGMVRKAEQSRNMSYC